MKTQGKVEKQPDFGSLSLRGRSFKGVVINDSMQKTVTVEWERRKLNQKYERYEKKRTRVKAHNPDSIDAKKGDLVEIRECRPLSKTKNFVVVKKIGKERLFAEREKSLEESKVKQKKAEPDKEDIEELDKTKEAVEEKVEEPKDESS